MAGFLRLVEGLLYYVVGLFWSPFMVFGMLVDILMKGPKGFWSCFESKDHSELPTGSFYFFVCYVYHRILHIAEYRRSNQRSSNTYFVLTLLI